MTTFPTLADMYQTSTAVRHVDKERLILIRAIEDALDNGEFDGFVPTEAQWLAFPQRQSYLDQAAREWNTPGFWRYD